MKRYAQWLLAPVPPVLTLLFLPLAAVGATYYVDAASGTDSGDCSAPCKTISYAATHVPAGAPGTPNVIMVAPGLYDETGNGESFPITFSNDHVALAGAGLATTIIDVDATDTWDALDVDAKGFTVSGFTFENSYVGGTQNFEAIDISEGGFTITGNRFGNTSVVDIGVRINRIEIDRSTSIAFGDMIISNNSFQTSFSGVSGTISIDFDGITEGLSMTVGNVIVSNNTFSLIDGSGMSMQAAMAQELVNGEVTAGDFTFTNNTVTGGVSGFYYFPMVNFLDDSLVTAGNTVVSNNTFTDQSIHGVSVDYWDANYINGSSNVTLGDLTISDNTVTADDMTYPDCLGIRLFDLGFWNNILDESTVTSGAVRVTNNHVDVADTAFFLTLHWIAVLGEEFWDDSAVVSVGPVTIDGNSFTSAEEYGVSVGYSDVAASTFGRSEVSLGPLAVTNNTVHSEKNALLINGVISGIYMHEESSLQVGPITVRDNTLTANNDGAIRILFDQVAKEMYDNASVLIKNMDFTGNTLTAGNGNGFSFLVDDYAYMMEDNTVLSVSPVNLRDNTIKATNGDGVNIEYADYEVGTYMLDKATAAFPDWNITDNSIDATGGNDGIFFYTQDNPCDNGGNAETHYGSILIDNNILNPNKDGGMANGIDLYLRNVGYDELLGPVTATFGDITVTNNRLHSLETRAIYLWYRRVGVDFTGAPVLTMGDIEMAGNTIETAPTGIDLEFQLYTESGAKVTIGEVDVHDNELDGISETGISAVYDSNNNDPDTATLDIGVLNLSDNRVAGSLATNNGIFLEVNNASDGINFARPIIRGNTISGFNNGLFLEDLDGAELSCNFVENNALIGMRFATDGTQFRVEHNSIVGNSVGLSIDTGDAAVVLAEKNWWGDKLGPVACASCNGVHPGDVGTVDFDPWLLSAPTSQCGSFPWPMFVPAITGAGIR